MTTFSNVSLFVQCLVDNFYPQVGDAMVEIFRRLDLKVDVPLAQTCCGQPAFNAGYRKTARKAARHFIDTFASAEVIVCPSGSCVDMVRHHYPDLFADDPVWQARATQVAQKTFELTEFLVDVLGVINLEARFDGRVTYHDSCHLTRHLGVARQPRALIQAVRGTELIEMADSDRCCGFGGTFAVKYADISTGMLAEKVANILATEAEVVIGCDLSCLLHIQGMLSRKKLPVRAMHIAELLVQK
ncbi:MAG: (Fe-S)-binding protein [Desulfosarcinaceae bacterium]|nr:(Fe-S)-binding protein [Desulfosarcinaceae bacterium]